MTKLIYGIDPTKEVTCFMIRDALIVCFVQAHKEVLDEMKEFNESVSDKELKNLQVMNVEMLIKKMFSDVDGDYENPTRDDIMKVCGRLADFATNFRKPEIIKKHYGKIMKLVRIMEG
ncbi:MAG: hypothetical protein OEL89_03110 [Candidatus Peregrinibacteria bacterium]|nr:hypothetical protein [Candidatus Peregrinibacteria bacterium]